MKHSVVKSPENRKQTFAIKKTLLTCQGAVWMKNENVKKSVKASYSIGCADGRLFFVLWAG